MTTTTTMTTMMGTIDIPCAGDEVKIAATLTSSSFILGNRQDRVLTIKAGNVKITSTSMPDKHVTLSTKCSCRFARRSTTKREKSIVRRVRWLIVHTLANYTVSVTSGYGSVDIRRFYVPYGLASKNVRPTRSGISLRLDEWAIY